MFSSTGHDPLGHVGLVVDLINQSMAQFQRQGELQRAQPLSRLIPWRSGTIWTTRQTPLTLDSWESCYTVAMEWPMNCETTVPDNEDVKALFGFFFFYHSISITHYSSLITLNTTPVWHHHSISITQYFSHYLWALYLSLIVGFFFFFFFIF